MRTRTSATFVALAATLVLAACGGKQSTEEEPMVEEEAVEEVVTGTIRVVHAATAGTVGVTLDGERAIESLEPAAVTERMEVPVGTYEMAIVSPSGTTEIFAAELMVAEDTDTTVVAVGGGDAGVSVVVLDDVDAPPAGSAFVRFVNASAEFGPLSVTADGRGYADDVAFASASGYFQMPAGSMNFEITDGTVTMETAANIRADVSYDLIAYWNGSEPAFIFVSEE